MAVTVPEGLISNPGEVLVVLKSATRREVFVSSFKPCSHSVWLGHASSHSRFVLLDRGRGIRTEVPFLRRLALQISLQR
ncbi:hypothetical protein AVEN_274794-1 [Araneus ventricosus]|uniref:Uncharacterized protein n=1 Tax=Araneus ventricosus TaxID=182803 RepID=A0A4Y2N5K2_ARAVE|nr:hypothetical protein AVEN_274794-1 [Araneus ventricosus]